MLRDITIGRYVPGNSALHRLDPRTKLLGALVYSAAVLSCSSFISMSAAGAAAVAAALISKIPVSYIIKGLKPLRWFILFTVIINLFCIDGKILWHLGAVHITYEGVSAAALLALRFIFFVLGTSLLTLTTPPIALTDGLARLLRPLKAVKLPADDIAMIISITLRFIPSFADEAERIMKAQKARGADFDSGSMISRVRSIMPVTIPLFISVFRRADELSLAMDARCYGKGVRNPRKKFFFGRTDAYFSLIMIIFCGFLAIIEFFN